MTAKPNTETDTAASETTDEPGTGQPQDKAPGTDAAAGAAQAPTGQADGAEPGDAAQEIALLQQQLETVSTNLAEQHDKFLRLNAEFDNYKKRIGKEHEDRLRYASLPLMKDLAGVIDNLSRALEHAAGDQQDDGDGLRAGIEMVLKQILDTAGRHGMEAIKAKGEAFDPTVHEAMAIVETDEVAEDRVVEEFQTGYRLHDRVIRPAMVSVSKRPAETPPEGN